MNLILPDKCFVVFIDDTGHEALAKNHHVYGLGGCAVMVRDLDRVIRQPWREVRRQVTGSADTPLHASYFGRNASQEQKNIVAEFFKNNLFFRIGAIISINTKLADEMSLMQTMKVVLQKRINDIIQSTLCREVKVIFEASERADKLIENAFQDLELKRGWKRIPSECYFMPKSATEPALEVADFIVNSVGKQERRRIKNGPGFNRDFVAVFHSVNSELVSYMGVEKVIFPNPMT